MAARDLPGAESPSDLSDSDDRDADEDTGGSEDAMLPATQPSNGRPGNFAVGPSRGERRADPGGARRADAAHARHPRPHGAASAGELVRYLSHLPQRGTVTTQPEGPGRVAPPAGRGPGRGDAAAGGGAGRDAPRDPNAGRAQGRQQDHVGALLERLTEADARTGRTLEAVETRLEVVGRHDAAVSESMESVARSSRGSTEVLEQLHEHLRSRDLGFERVVERQGTRFTSILAVATLLAVAALTGVGILGYLFVNRAHF